MADKKTKSRSAPKKAKPQTGVVGLLKKIVDRRPASAPKKARPPRKPAPPGAAPRRAARGGAPSPKQAAKSQSGKAAPGTEYRAAPAARSPVDSAGPDKARRKPPSITITRPEATRPPVVQLPPPKLEAPVGAPSILLPKGGQSVASLTPIFRWMYVGSATRYEVEWSHDAHFGRGHGTTIVSLQTAITLDEAHALKSATNYQWRVRGGNDAGWGPWSGAESFRSPDKV